MRPLVLALYTCSGAAGLVLEAVLLRELTWLSGSSTTATAIVLAGFMGGLAAGAAAFGALADRSSRPLAVFAALEIAAALAGAALAWSLGTGREWLLAPLRPLPGAIGPLSFLLVMLPAVPMGGTLPALTRLWVCDPARVAGGVGLLYGLNTLGGALGVFVAGFFLFERLGIAASAYFAAGVQVSVGLVALILSARAGVRERVTTESAEAALAPSPARRASLVGACACGAIVLGYEVVWTRLLSLPLRSFAYSFSMMLALFLAGLCGGALLAPQVARRTGRPAVTLGWLLVVMGGSVALSLAWLPALLAPAEGAASFGGFLVRGGLRAAAIVLPPTILSGIALPLAAHAFAPAAERIGRGVGAVYALNTAGAIAGAVAVGLVALPSLGARSSLILLAALNALAGAAVLWLAARSAVPALLGMAVAAACALPLAGGGQAFVGAFLRATSAREKIGEVLFFHEGAADTVAIVRKDYGFHDPQAKSLITNGVAMSATVKPVWRYMALEGHLPVLLSTRPERALAVGVGTGITLGAVASHARLAAIDAVELSSGVLRGLPVFAAENGEPWEDPRVRLRVQDGRHHLELEPTAYDVITVEPPPPIVAGAVHLYSLDFYELCRRRLRPGGVVAQWLPLHSQSLLSARMTLSTFLAAFPHAQLWLPSAQDAVLVGSLEPLRLEHGRLEAAFAAPASGANLRRAYLETPAALLATFLLDRAGLERWADGAPPITDEHPRMEFFRNQGGNMEPGDRLGLLDLPQAALDWVTGLDAETAAAIAVESRALRLYLRSAAAADAEAGTAAAALARGTEFFLYRLGCASEQLARLAEPAAAQQLSRCALLRVD